jgi:shikimate 5-dehydrogenase
MNFYSLSKFPGKTGEYYYNTIFKRKGIAATYTALACDNIKNSVQEMKDMNAAGFSVSMPYKVTVMDYLDEIDASSSIYNSCNTVVNRNGKLVGYNADLAGVLYFSSLISGSVSILGNGAMASMFSKFLPKATMYARALGNWDSRYECNGTVINCTGLGTISPESPFESLPNVSTILDLTIKPNQLESQCKAAGVKYVGGLEFYKRQFIHQFSIYTGVDLTLEEVSAL